MPQKFPFFEGNLILASLVIENLAEGPPEPQQLTNELRARKAPSRNESPQELAVELGIWLSGLESFLAAGHYSFTTTEAARTVPDTVKELQLTQAALVRCAALSARLIASEGEGGIPTGRELSLLSGALRDSILIGECIVRSDSRGIAEWRAWSSTLNARLSHLAASKKLISMADAAGEKFLPAKLMQVIGDTSGEHAELALVLPKFGKVLRWLSIVGQMLKADEPLKPALLIFSSVNEQVQELINSINNRLERFPDNEAEMFGSLDAASYTASIELKKVYTQELAGVAKLRPSPSIYARMETAHSLLSEGFQQMLAGFATSIDNQVTALTLWPNFQEKLDQSIILRDKLFTLTEQVGAAEKDPDKKAIETLHASLRAFMEQEVRYLFYKDSETVERFVEEILVTKQNKDLVPILHRFGAYLETLFGQVCLRAVLAEHPFQS